MIDIQRVRDNPEKIVELLSRKGYELDFDKLIKLDNSRRKSLQVCEELNAKRNAISRQIPLIQKAKGDIQPLLAESREIGELIAIHNKKAEKASEKLTNLLLSIPNIPDEDLLAGEKENNVIVLNSIAPKPNFEFKIKDHVELAESLGLVDYKRAAKISGFGTWIYTDLGARLEWALINLFIQEHLNDGYRFIMPPLLLNEESGYVVGQFPKFKDDVFWLKGMEPKRFMLPTAETALVNLHRNEILNEDDLPLKYFAYTPCFRSEAGSHRQDERGMIRGFQFNKVEMVIYAKPSDSAIAFEELTRKATRIMDKLGLHYHMSKLAAGDCSFSMARTYDIEVFLPSIGIYKEVSSVSNAGDYQARRGLIRYRDKESGKTVLCHTLNGSGLATSRLFPAILEQFQQPDGSVLVPEALLPWMGGVKILKPIK